MSRLTPFPKLLAEVRLAVDASMAEVWSAEISGRSTSGDAVREPLSSARDLCLRGGKRLRAALLSAAYCAAQPQGVSASFLDVVQISTAVELLQSYFLIHDDWMDQDLQRRGGPAVHAHLARHWSSEHLGAAGGVLAGDYVLALATRLVATAPEAQPVLSLVVAQFAQMQLDAVSGQLLDVLDPDPNIEHVYQLKTGSYTVVGPLKMGLILAGASSNWFPELETYGLSLGVAFQLQDDLIGLFASESASGKPLGSDLKSGKHTLLFRTALEMSTGEARDVLVAGFGNVRATPEQVRVMIREVEACGAREAVQRRIAALVAKATDAVNSSSQMEPEVRQMFRDIAMALTARGA